MLDGIFALLAQRPLPIDEIRAILQSHQLDFDNLTTISGSFKTLYALNHEVAVASVSAINKDMLSKEKILLSKLAELGLPTIQYYTDVFEFQLNRQAVLMQWVPDSTLIDSKDFESAHQKLIIAALGIDIPVTGEAWVLHKIAIDQKIHQLFSAKPEIFIQVKQFALNLHRALLSIIMNLETNGVRIADLQLLVTKEGNVSIIDPIDVVHVKARYDNTNIYHSLLDDSIQDNQAFIKQLGLGQTMLNNCLEWCSTISKLSSNQEMQKFITMPPKVAVTSCNIRKSLLMKTASSQLYRQSPLAQQNACLLPASSSMPNVSPSSLTRKKLPRTTITKRKSPESSPEKVLKTSPTKKQRAIIQEQVSDLLDSPSKIIAFQFSAVQLSASSSESAKRKLSFSSDQLTITHYEDDENSSIKPL
ncbi:MAG: hypothetical protein HYX61_05375 [Gammaproteobacteria bacterium]|jgi:hypothetical protein|nr:hypothetical protein [Gammaproteobacteria bacterium]